MSASRRALVFQELKNKRAREEIESPHQNSMTTRVGLGFTALALVMNSGVTEYTSSGTGVKDKIVWLTAVILAIQPYKNDWTLEHKFVNTVSATKRARSDFASELLRCGFYPQLVKLFRHEKELAARTLVLLHDVKGNYWGGEMGLNAGSYEPVPALHATELWGYFQKMGSVYCSDVRPPQMDLKTYTSLTDEDRKTAKDPQILTIYCPAEAHQEDALAAGEENHAPVFRARPSTLETTRAYVDRTTNKNMTEPAMEFMGDLLYEDGRVAEIAICARMNVLPVHAVPKTHWAPWLKSHFSMLDMMLVGWLDIGRSLAWNPVQDVSFGVTMVVSHPMYSPIASVLRKFGYPASAEAVSTFFGRPLNRQDTSFTADRHPGVLAITPAAKGEERGYSIEGLIAFTAQKKGLFLVVTTSLLTNVETHVEEGRLPIPDGQTEVGDLILTATASNMRSYKWPPVDWKYACPGDVPNRDNFFVVSIVPLEERVQVAYHPRPPAMLPPVFQGQDLKYPVSPLVKLGDNTTEPVDTWDFPANGKNSSVVTPISLAANPETEASAALQAQ